MAGGSAPALFVADAGPDKFSGKAGQVVVVQPTPPYAFIGKPGSSACGLLDGRLHDGHTVLI